MARMEWSRLGFILATIGSAVGLGNLWRFPYVVSENGGGAFLLPFAIIFLLFGIPLMMLELAAGRRFRGSVVTSLKRINPRLRYLGIAPVAITIAVFSYYLVIAGWVLSYFFFSFTGYLEFEDYTQSSLPIIAFFATLLLTLYVVQFDIKKGIERANTFLMPLLFFFVGVMLIQALLLPGVGEGVAYYLTPDLGALFTPGIWIAASAQVFFSLGVGFGILVTYGSYLSREENIPGSTLIIAGADVLVALMAGLIVFPIVFTFGFDPVAGPGLAFITLPRIFAIMPFGNIFGPMFFLLLLIGAFSSAISMMEVGVSALVDEVNFSRRKATLLLAGITALIGLPSVLSYAGWDITLAGRPFLDVMDLTFGTLALSLVAAFICIGISWFWDPDEMLEEMGKNSGIRFPRLLVPLLRYVIPVALIGVFLFDLFGFV
jgi:neurotransmitter:Na+ symporter, NSS family